MDIKQKILGGNVEGDLSPIDEIIKEEPGIGTDIVVEGRIVNLNAREYSKKYKQRNGTEKVHTNYTYSGGIYNENSNWDGSNSIAFHIKTKNQPLNLKNGMFVKADGFVDHKRQRERTEVVLSVTNMIELENSPSKVIDTAEEKRVELTNVGSYSLHVSSTKVEDYAKFAKEIGHKGFVVTDINSAQGFPEAYRAAKANDLKLVFGTKLMVTPYKPIVFGKVKPTTLKEETFVIFDVETTGLSNAHDYIIEIGAVKIQNGKVIDRFQEFVKSPKAISETIYELTKITQEMSDNGIEQIEALTSFASFIEGSVLVAHNAEFDLGMLNSSFKRVNIPFEDYTIIDTLGISRAVNVEFKLHNLKTLSKFYNIDLVNHHRADSDAEATATMLLAMIQQLESVGVHSINQLNDLIDDLYYQKLFAYEVTLLAQNEIGLKNIYKLITAAHTEYMGKDGRPKVPHYVLEQHREGLLVGSGSSHGFLFELGLNKTAHDISLVLDNYDYIEIEPNEIGVHTVRTEKDERGMQVAHAWKTIVEEAEKKNKLIVATGNVYYLNKSDRMHQHVLLYSKTGGAKDGKRSNIHGYKHFRMTDEMLEEFSWLSEEKRHEYVITNSNKIFDSCEMVNPIPSGFHPPKLEGVDEKLERDAYTKAKSIYGNPLPTHIHERLERELKSIIGNGFTVIYSISQELVEESMRQGYLVGSRGSVGSSFAAFCTNITEVNALKPHYVCPGCKKSVFFDTEELQSGFDLPKNFSSLLDPNKYNEKTRKHVLEIFEMEFGDKAEELLKTHKTNTCLWCNHEGLIRDGQDIPFETFLGFKGDKTPDIDLNFSGEYQPRAHKFISDRLGEENCYRAGTISTVADKTAFGYAQKYKEEQGFTWSNAEASRIASLTAGSKRTTGQHPGGIIVLPEHMDITDFGGCNYPANDKSNPMKTTHFAYTHIHDNLAKFDILGHDDPTVLYLLKQWTGIDPRTVDVTDEKVLKLFTNPKEAIGVDLNLISSPTATLGISEFGTEFVQQMIVDTQPTTYAELVKISGLSHGTDVWLNNAQELILKGVCTLKDVIDTRDNIMVFLQQKGLEDSLAFTIMESVRKGKGLTPEWEEIMRGHDVPQWYIDSCNKIRYMFPKAHAAAYVLSALRIAWFKVYYPIQYYAAQFSVRWTDMSVFEVLKTASEVRERLEELKRIVAEKKKMYQPFQVEMDKITILKNLYEAKVRGIDFANIRLYGSEGALWVVKDNKIIPPFVSLPGVGVENAEKLNMEAKEPFTSIADLKKRAKVSDTVLGHFDKLKLLGLVDLKNHTFF
ncbi:PolC-type DNA polymerase III [Bacillus luti]|nr:PHP domain-containing protein [Bacillus cereus]HDR8327661.1 PHP domain-containing protein [Bacillus cereus]HDR8334370.1 PHP domain-containing protein [Bacillus cereus]